MMEKSIGIYFFAGIIFTFMNLSSEVVLAQQENVKTELKHLLTEFLEGASVNDRAMHERFWADDLIYTSSAGDRFGKSEIMAGLAPINQEQEPTTTRYDADEIQIKVYDGLAVVAFRLIAEISDLDGLIDVMNFYNTGTFIKRDGEWRAVAWQATRIE